MERNSKSKFEEKLKPLLHYVGTIGAGIMTVCYIITVLILVFGFQVQTHHLKQSIIFAVVNGVVGFIIMQLLKIQGIDFAKSENKDLIDKYNKIVLLKCETDKKKKAHSIKFYWITSVIKDFILKGLSVVLGSFSLIYIVIEGSQDYSLLLLAVVNLLMFICFGLLSLVNSYDWYNGNHVNYMQTMIDETEIEKLELGDIKENVNN